MSNHIAPTLLRPKKLDHERCPDCGDGLIVDRQGWINHHCKNWNNQNQLMIVRNPPPKSPSNTTATWQPSPPWFTAAEVKERNDKIKKEEPEFEMVMPPPKPRKEESHKINLYEQVNFTVSNPYSN